MSPYPSSLIVLLSSFASSVAWGALVAPVTYDARFIDQNWTWQGDATRGIVDLNGKEVLQVATSHGYVLGGASFQTEYTEYVATFRLKLFSSGVEDYRAALGLSGVREILGGTADRSHIVYLVPGEIGLLANGSGSPMPRASLYSFDFVDVSMAIRLPASGTGIQLDVYVNESTEDILNRTADPVLAKTLTKHVSDGVIRFGDTSTEFDSYYMLESITVQGIAVPEPAGTGLIMVGAVYSLGLRRPRRAVG
jgi:hypothetical protein